MSVSQGTEAEETKERSPRPTLLPTNHTATTTMHSCSRVPWGRGGALALPGQWGHPVLVTCHTLAHSLPEPTWTGSTATPSDRPGLGPHCSKLVPQASWSKTRSIPWTKERHQAGAESLPPQETPTTGSPPGLTPPQWAAGPGDRWVPEPPYLVCLYRTVLCSAHPTRSGSGAARPPLGFDLMPESVVQWSRASLKCLIFAGLNLNALFSSWDPWKAMHLL